MRTRLKSQAGAFDLSAVIVGAVAVGILSAGIYASTAGQIPWAQDKTAQQAISHIRTAQAVAQRSERSFQTMNELKDKKYITTPGSVVWSIGEEGPRGEPGSCYLAIAPSKSGKLYFASNKITEPMPMTQESLGNYVQERNSCKIAGSSSAEENSAAITDLAELTGRHIK